MSPNEPTPIPILDLKSQYASIREEIHAALDHVLESQHFILGPEVSALEEEIAAYSQCQYSIGVSSGTDALLVALMALGVKPGDEVITSSYSFFATAGAVARLGARPVFVDIDPGTLNLRPEAIEPLINARTRAIIPVHFCGQVADMDPILEISDRFNMPVIEDAAQAIGAEYKGKRAGSFGDLACLSFFPSKNLGGYGDSGMVLTNNPELAERVALLRTHGARPKYHHKLVGGNFRMDAIQAAVLRVKFKYLDLWTAARQRNAGNYRRLFVEHCLAAPGSEVGDYPVQLPAETGWGRHIYHLFQIRVTRRDELQAYLLSQHIGSEVYYPVPLHLQECFSSLGYFPGSLPASERAALETLAIPIYPELTVADQSRVVEAIASFFNGAS